MPLPDFDPLPELGKRSDAVFAVLLVEGAVLFLRKSRHAGPYLKLPGGHREVNEALEVSCRRKAIEELRDASREFGRQLHVELHEETLDLVVGEKVGEHASGRLGRNHYFSVVGSAHTILAGPSAQPQIDPSRLIWRPYVWVPLSDLHSVPIWPPEAVAICVEAAKKQPNQSPEPTPTAVTPRAVEGKSK